MTGLHEVHAAIRMAAAAAERQDYPTALRILRAIYENGKEPPAEGRSLYGLCLAIVEKKTRIGIEQCTEAIELQSYDSRHRINLIKLYLAIGSRRKAVEVLEKGLVLLPSDSGLLTWRERIGYRQRSPIPFLSRSHPLNEFLGKLRRN